jgi:maltose 6'-phosphate phosphatase
MKLLTWNIHARPEQGTQSVERLAEYIVRESIDVLALQEVNQSMTAAAVSDDILAAVGYVPLPSELRCSLPVKQDNAVLVLAQALWKSGQYYRWLWLPIKCGYDCYDEGVALLLRCAPDAIVAPWLSTTTDVSDWRTRRALGARCGGIWFYSVHTGRWGDYKEPFFLQWRRLMESSKGCGEPVILLGDFNCPAEERGGGYDRMMADGFYDTYVLARARQGEATALGRIDGWNDCSIDHPMRIDFILCDRPRKVALSRTLPDGPDSAPISDHFGVMAVLEDQDGTEG